MTRFLRPCFFGVLLLALMTGRADTRLSANGWPVTV